MAAATSSSYFAGLFPAFDDELAEPATAEPEIAFGTDQPDERDEHEIFPPPAPKTLADIAEEQGTPESVFLGFLAELGLEGTALPTLLLDFDTADLTDARRGFHVDGIAATGMQRAQITAWMRAVTAAAGPRAPNLLDGTAVGGSTAAPPPPPTRLPAAPAGPSVALPIFDHGRAAQASPLSAAEPALRAVPPGVMPTVAKAPGIHAPRMMAAPAPGTALGAVAMKEIIDPLHPGSFLPFTGDEVEAAWVMHERITGLRPRAEQEPSAEQLGALAAKLRSNEPPYVEFSVWGPFDRRQAKDRKCLAMVWVEGALQPRTLQGPSSFAAWDQHWAVFATAMLSLGACANGPLDRYRAGIDDLQKLYPTCGA